MTRSFSALTKHLGPERRVRIEQRKEQLRQEMTLARTLNVKQAEISKIENRADMLMSTLRNFVQAMGGDLEVRALSPPWPASPRRSALARSSSSYWPRRNCTQKASWSLGISSGGWGQWKGAELGVEH
jgi:hypothetical protein